MSIQGTVEKVLEKTSSGGDPYRVIRLEDSEDGFFVWDQSHFADADQLQPGDQVAMAVDTDGDGPPRVHGINKLEDGGGSSPDTPPSGGRSTQKQDRIRANSACQRAVETLAEFGQPQNHAELEDLLTEWAGFFYQLMQDLERGQ